MVWCVSVVSEKRHEFHVLGVGGCRNVTKRRIPKNPLSRGKGGIIFSGYDDLKQRLGVAGILCYLRRFLKVTWGKNMFEVDPLLISEYDFQVKLEYSHTAFPDSIRSSRNVSSVMGPIAIRS